ncbi:MAG: hypothetical protein KF909_00155 [Rhodocyclaceae bacterium]|nr:hypothetical protein [Rhodocyclaceae bacterium]MCP5232638.1 hypothetical protein [Zoogloeaceae bacterium]MCB1911717.1 hypothetical protein [Rhodocyclaceae bacterium]MCP5240668.1 hypothetical protein [Zoogloeaceae bacterium]MCP5253219.1 hypothetical protein [Zoogloeaceae bacterium]
MSRKSDLAMRQLLCTAAVALAVPTAAGTAHAAPLTGKQSMTGVESKRNSRSRARAEEEAAAAALFPLTLRPVARTTDEETSDAIQVRVEDASGRRVILARAHGKCVVGPLPAGEYTVHLKAGNRTEEHAMLLGAGKRGLLRYELGA